MSISKISQYVLKLVDDYNNNRETSLEYVKDFIYKRTDVTYSEFATKFSKINQLANAKLVKYGMKVGRSSVKHVTLSHIRKKNTEVIFLSEEDAKLLKVLKELKDI